MSGQGRRFGRQLRADIATDLSHPYRMTPKGHRGQPEPEMIALVDVRARFLQADVLRSTEKVERAEGCIAVSRADQRGADRLQARAERPFGRFIPAGPHHAVLHGWIGSHQEEVDGIACLGCLLVGRAAR